MGADRGEMDDDALENFSVDSLDYVNTEPLLNSPSVADKQKPMRSSKPFRLHDSTGHGNHSLVELAFAQDCKETWNCEIDENVLTKKGLQLNKDGSFSKSPREELPFVMPALQVALIKKRKQERSSQESLTNKPVRNARMMDKSLNLIRCDELSRLKTSGNLTDSMKEALFKSCKYSKKPEDILSKDLRICDKRNGEETTRSSKELKKNRSDFYLPSIQRPSRMSYYERYQKKIGFNPRSLSLKGKKPATDTVRSNLGDSVRDSLSEVSAGFVPMVEDESEELFYQKIMANEQMKPKNSSRIIIDGCSGENGVEKTSGRKKEIKLGRMKSLTESPVSTSSVAPTSLFSYNGKKNRHRCAADPVPKAELMSKARAYGNQVNMWNIIRLQMKCQGKPPWHFPGDAPGSDRLLPPVSCKGSQLKKGFT